MSLKSIWKRMTRDELQEVRKRLIEQQCTSLVMNYLHAELDGLMLKMRADVANKRLEEGGSDERFVVMVNGRKV